jgi:outer membrane biosynthesis protein TonB
MQNSEVRIHTSNAPRAGRLAVAAFCLLPSAFLAAGCASKATAAATTVPDGPPLAMPEPPPRVILLVEDIPEPPPPAPAPEPTVTAKPPVTAKPAAARTEPPVVAAPPPPPPAATEPPREVRSVPSAAAAAEERKVREVTARAAKDLLRVDYQRLSVDGKSQYDQSKRFSEQAEQAIKEKNYVYAMELAEKAARLAGELAGR